MILLLDTSTPTCRLTLIDSEIRHESQWQADRTLAKGLLGYLDAQLRGNGWTFADITGIGVFEGPGSFTGLRIGMAVLNTLADAQGISIVGARGEAWQTEAVARMRAGDNDRIVLPFYASEAHITKPRK